MSKKKEKKKEEVRLKDSFESTIIIELIVVINATKVFHL
jgi:hypothetical protein